MSEDKSIDRSELLALTAEIVAARVANHAVSHIDLGVLIQSGVETMSGLAAGGI